MSGPVTETDDEERWLQPYASVVSVERAVGALLAPGDESALPEGLARQLHDPTVVEDTPLYWFRTVASTGSIDHYGTVMQPDSLRNYASDAEDGLPFCNSHQHQELPFGRTYAGRYRAARGESLARTEMDVYLPYDMNVNGVDTTHFIKAVRSGIARDVSIAFDPQQIVCSLDGRNMPRGMLELLLSDPEDPNSPCRHIPGVIYDNNGTKERALGKIHGAHCLELSPVFRGATPGAAILSPSRAMQVDERTGPPGWALQSPSLRTAAMLAEADLLDRAVALALESHVRGVRFPSVTTRAVGGWSADPKPAPEPEDPRAEDDDDQRLPDPEPIPEPQSQEEENARMSSSASADPEPATIETPASGEEAVLSTLAAPPPASVLPPPATRAVVTAPFAAEAEPAGAPLWHAEVRSALLAAHLAPDGFAGDPLVRVAELGRELEAERLWGGWGRRYREELCAELESEGVRAFGAETWSASRAAYLPILERGSADDLLALRTHFREQATARLRGGRLSQDDAEPPATTRSEDTASANPRKVPAYAYRS